MWVLFNGIPLHCLPENRNSVFAEMSFMLCSVLTCRVEILTSSSWTWLPNFQTAEMKVYKTYVRAVLSDAFPRDPCLYPSLSPPCFLQFLCYVWGPTLLPSPFPIHSWNMGGKGILHVLKMNLGIVCCQGRVPISQLQPEFPFPCFLQPHPGLLLASKGLLVVDY